MPQVVHHSDPQNIAYYDVLLRKYVGYFRTHVFGKRSIGRAETDDFRHFPLPETVMWPDASLGLLTHGPHMEGCPIPVRQTAI